MTPDRTPADLTLSDFHRDLQPLVARVDALRLETAEIVADTHEIIRRSRDLHARLQGAADRPVVRPRTTR